MEILIIIFVAVVAFITGVLFTKKYEVPDKSGVYLESIKLNLNGESLSWRLDSRIKDCIRKVIHFHSVEDTLFHAEAYFMRELYNIIQDTNDVNHTEVVGILDGKVINLSINLDLGVVD